MANRNFDQYDLTIQKRIAHLWGVFSMSGTTPVLQKWVYPSLGGASAGSSPRTYVAAPATGGGTSFPTRYAQGAEGIFSVARTGVGLWTVTLQDNYQRLLGLRVDMALAGGLANVTDIAENTTFSNMAATGGSVIGLTLLSGTGVAADPSNGALVRIEFVLHDATEP